MFLPFLLSGLLAFSGVSSLSISQAGIVGSDGLDEETPIAEDDSFTLKCDLQVQGTSDEWLLCMWTHVLEDEIDANNEELRIVCSTSPDGSSQCSNKGGSPELSSYASRVTLVTSANSCGMSVRGAEARDNGRWECHVTDSSIGGGQHYSYIDIHVANQTTIFITDPDLEEDSSQTIEYDLEDERAEIEATCTGYGGKPEPTFRWFINDDRNEISESDIQRRLRPGKDSVLGEYVEETIVFQPTLEDLCTRYDIDDYACETNKRRYHFFNFNLICKADQGSYFERENDDQEAMVTVDVVSGSSAPLASLVVLLLSSIISQW